MICFVVVGCCFVLVDSVQKSNAEVSSIDILTTRTTKTNKNWLNNAVHVKRTSPIHNSNQMMSRVSRERDIVDNTKKNLNCTWIWNCLIMHNANRFERRREQTTIHRFVCGTVAACAYVRIFIDWMAIQSV